MEELRLLFDFSESPELYKPEERERFLREAVAQIEKLAQKHKVSVNEIQIAAVEFEETVANNSKLSNWTSSNPANE